MNRAVILPVVEHALNQGVQHTVICYSNEHNGANENKDQTHHRPNNSTVLESFDACTYNP